MGEGVLAAGSAPRRYRHGEVVVGQGQAVTCLRLVVSGAIRLSAVVRSGREVVVGLLGPGEVFGEVALLGGGPSPVRAQAVGTETAVVAIPLETLREIVLHRPATAEELLRLVANRLHHTAVALEQTLAHDVPARVSLRLRDLAHRHGTADGNGVALPPRLTQDELGRMVGATRESVNRTLSSLAARGLVRVEDRRYVLPDPEALAAAAED